MRFDLQEDQAALLDGLDKLLAQELVRETPAPQRSHFNAAADQALEQSGFLDVAGHEGFGPVMPALVVEAIAARPLIVEAAASCFVRPIICPDWPRPLAVIAGRPDRPARFLHEAKSVLFFDDIDARMCRVSPADSVPLDSFFAYPMARLNDPSACHARAQRVGDVQTAKRLLLLATASELAGLLSGALASVTDHVTNRRQFGRPIGSFQAVQHRLAMAASNIAAGKQLTRKAAALGSFDDALLATGYLQDCATRILYDLHQFMGAMGLTLEHPLYRWSYRAKLLASELGGASAQLRGVADAVWA